MERSRSGRENTQRKFQVVIGEKIAYVEIISLTNYICAVEIAGREPIFITRVRDKNDKPCWISIPQGNDALATEIGNYIEEQTHFP